MWGRLKHQGFAFFLSFLISLSVGPHVHAAWYHDLGDFFVKDIPNFFENDVVDFFIPSDDPDDMPAWVNSFPGLDELVDTSTGPDNFRVQHGTLSPDPNENVDVDRDASIHLRWDAKYFDGNRADKYRIVILGGKPSPALGLPMSIEHDYVLRPFEVDDNPATGDEQKAVIDLLELIGPNFEGDTGNKGNLIKNMVNYRTATTLYFGVQATRSKDPEGRQDTVENLDETNRQVVNADGSYQTVNLDTYTFVGAKFSRFIAVKIKLDPVPSILKVRALERVAGESGRFVYTDKTPVAGVIEEIVGDFGAEQTIDLNSDPEIDAVYADADGHVDLRWVQDNGSSPDTIPLYGEYEVEVSKWPKFTFRRPAFFNQNVVDRYFNAGENVHFLYNNFKDYSQPMDDSQPPMRVSLSSDYYYNEANDLIRPFFTKNLSIRGFQKEGLVTNFGRPHYNDDDDYNPYAGKYYFRVRARGLENAYRENGDNRAGPWSNMIVVDVTPNARISDTVQFTQEPETIAGAADHIARGQVPLNFELASGDPLNVNPEYIYQILVSRHSESELFLNSKILNNELREGRGYDYFFDYVLADDAFNDSADPQKSTCLVDMLADTSVLEAGTYNFWARVVTNESDSIPSVWSRPLVNIELPRFDLVEAPQPIISAIDMSLEGLEPGKVPLTWNFEEAPQDPRSATYADSDNNQNNRFIPLYQLLVYKSSDAVSPIRTVGDKTGKLKFQDLDNNEINDWTEIKHPGGQGKAYAVYQIRHDEILDATKNAMYHVPLTDIYDVVRNQQNEILTDTQTGDPLLQVNGQTIEAGEYDFYLIATNIAEQQGLVSVKQSVQLDRLGVVVPPQSDLNIMGHDDSGSVDTALQANLDEGKIPVNWSYVDVDPTSPLDATYTNNAATNDRFVKSHMIVVYRDEEGLNPVQAGTQNLLFADENENGNDWLELGSFDPVTGERDSSQPGKAYAVYQVNDTDLAEISDETGAFFEVPLTTIFNVLRDGEGEPVLDADRDLRFNSVGQSIVAGDYHFYIVAANRFGHQGQVSAVKTVTMPAVNVSVPPKPLAVLGGEVDLTTAKVPLRWSFPDEDLASDRDPLNTKYTNATSEDRIPRYFIAVYKQESGLVPRDPDTQKLKFEDNDGDGLNDWLEIGVFDESTGLRDTSNQAKAYAVYQVTREDLISITSGQSDKFFEMSLASIYEEVSENNFAPIGRSVKEADYDFYVISTNRFDHQSDISDALTVHLTDVVVKEAPKPIVHEVDESSDKKNMGLVPLKWTYDVQDSDSTDSFDETEPLEDEYLTVANENHVPRHFIVVYANDAEDVSLDPLNAATSKIKNEDLNNNAINDWLEIGSFSVTTDADGNETLLREGAGKAYAVYQVTAQQLRQFTRNQDDVYAELPLTTIYDVIRSSTDDGEDVFVRDEDGDFRYKARGQNIVEGSYTFYMISTNSLDHESELSDPISVDLPRVDVANPPKPIASEVRVSDAADEGVIPITWTFEADTPELEDPLNDRYLTETDSKYLPRYFVVVYADEEGLDPLDPNTSQIKFEDHNGNEINDWLELGVFTSSEVNGDLVLTRDTQQGGKAYAVYQIEAKDLEELPENPLHNILYNIPLTSVYHPIVGTNGEFLRDAERNIRYEQVGQSIVAGTYNCYLFSNGRFDLISDLSASVSVEMDAVDVVEPPKPYVDFPLGDFEQKVNVGRVPLHWNFDDVETPALEDPLHLSYTNEDLVTHIPRYDLLVYRVEDLDGDGVTDRVNPVNADTGQLEFVDENDNNINDYLEIRVLNDQGLLDDTVSGNTGKAYAYYQLSNQDILSFTEDQDPKSVFYEAPLVSIFDVVRDQSGDVRRNADEDLMFEMRGQSIAEGEYDFYLIASNHLSMRGDVSERVSVNMPHVDVQEPPQPTISDIDETDADVVAVLAEGDVQLHWQFLENDAISVEPRDDAYTLNQDGTNVHFIPQYQVVVYAENTLFPDGEDPLDPIDEFTHKLLYEDVDADGINDWIQIKQDADDEYGKAYATYRVTYEELMDMFDETGFHAKLPLINIYDVARDPASNNVNNYLKDDEDDYIYELRGETLFAGRYYIYVYAYNSFDHRGQVSEPEELVVENTVLVKDAPTPVISEVDVETASLAQGVIPLLWSLDVDEPASTDPRDDVYDEPLMTDGTTVNDDFIPYYQIVVYKGTGIDPVEQNNRFKFEDHNGNDINDWLEIERRDIDGSRVNEPSNIGKAYAIYRVNSDEILSDHRTPEQISANVLDVMSKIKLTDIFDVKRDEQGELVADGDGLVYERKGQSVLADTYRIYMTSVNRFEHESYVSDPIDVVFDEDIVVVDPPRPIIETIREDDPYLSYGRIPLLWSFDEVAPRDDPRDSVYTNTVKAVPNQVDPVRNDEFLPEYQVIVYKAEVNDQNEPVVPENPFDAEGRLLFADVNGVEQAGNGLNDYLEIDQGDGVGKAYAVYRFKHDEILPAPVAQEGETTRADVMYRVPLLRIFDVVEDSVNGGFERDGDNHIKFVGRTQSIEPGDYYFYLMAMNRQGHEGLVSEPQSVTITNRIDEIVPPRPMISAIDTTDPNIQLFGKVPLHWTLPVDDNIANNESPRLDKYRRSLIEDPNQANQEIANGHYIPFYQLFVYRASTAADGSVVAPENPFDDTHFLLKNDDENDNGVNDWTEIKQGPDDHGKAYAVYRILESDLLDDTREADEVARGDQDKLYQVPLVKIYEILRGEANVLQSDAQGNFVYRMRPQSIESGHYYFYLAAANPIDELGPVSEGQALHVTEDVNVKYAPKPNLLRPNSNDAGSTPVRDRGQIPVFWKLTVGEDDLAENSAIEVPANGTTDVSVLQDDFALESNETYVPTYQVYVYANLGTEDPRVSLDPNILGPQERVGFLKEDDVNENGISDWAERSSDREGGVVGGRLFAQFQLTTADIDQLVEQALAAELRDIENNNNIDTTDVVEVVDPTPRLEMDWAQTIGLDTFFRLKVDADGQPVKRNGQLVFEGDFQDVPAGTYSLFVFGINGMDLEGPLSDVKTVDIPNAIAIADTPEPLVLSAFTPNPDRNGILGVNWTIGGDATEPDRLDTYPLYEVIIGKGTDPLNEINDVNGEFSRDYVESMGDFPLMVVNQATQDLEKVSAWPWVRDLRDEIFPLGYTPEGTSAFRALGFDDHTSYTMRVRAYTHLGSVSKKGPWSNPQTVFVDLRDDALIAPYIPRTDGPNRVASPDEAPADRVMDDPFSVYNGTQLIGYFMYFQIERGAATGEELRRRTEAAERAQFIEIWESEDGTTWDTLEGDSTKVRNLFFLDKSQPHGRALPPDNVPFWEFGRSPSANQVFRERDERYGLSRPEFGHSYYYAARFVEAEFDLSSPDRVNDTLPGEWSDIVLVHIDEGALPNDRGADDNTRPQRTWRRTGPE